MNIETLISPETIRRALEDVLEKLFRVDKLDALRLARRPLGERAVDVQRNIIKDIIDVHLLKDVVRYALDDVAEHAEAIDKLGDGRASLLHVRHIEEIHAVITFLVSKPDRYGEFKWRWDNFDTIHAIRNRLINLKQPLEPVMQDWVVKNLASIQGFYNKKITIDCEATKDQWEKVSNWLYPIYLKEVFEVAGRKESYVSAEYDWNSQAVHFSPLAETYLGFKLKHMTYSEFSVSSASRFVNGFCRECLPLVGNTKQLRQYHAKMVILEMYRMLLEKPGQYIDLANKGATTAHFTNILLGNPTDIDVVVNAVIGEAKADPLVIKV